MVGYIWQAIAAAILFGLGMVFYKKGLAGVSKKYGLKRLIKQLLNRYLISGLLLTIVGFLFYLRALSYGEVSVVAPLLNISLVTVWGMGLVYLKEKLNKQEFIGVGLIVMGTILLSL